MEFTGISHDSSSARHIFLFLLLFILYGVISLQSIAMVSAWRESLMALLGHSCLFLVTGSAAIGSMYICFACFKSRYSKADMADCTLLYLAGITPLVLFVSRFNPLPTSDDSKANCVITYAFLLRLGSLLDLPPAHSIVQIVLSFPLFT